MILYNMLQSVYAADGGEINININVDTNMCEVTTDLVSMVGLYGAPLLLGGVVAFSMVGSWSKSLASRNKSTGPAVTAGYTAGLAIASIVFTSMLYVTSGQCFPDAWFLPSLIIMFISIGLAGFNYSKM